MPEVDVKRPWEAAQALVAEHVKKRFGIVNANALLVLADIAFDTEEETRERRQAASTLLEYTQPKVRAVEITLSGEVDVNHSIVTQARTKAKSFLDRAEEAKRLMGNVVEGEVIPPQLAGRTEAESPAAATQGEDPPSDGGR